MSLSATAVVETRGIVPSVYARDAFGYEPIELTSREFAGASGDEPLLNAFSHPASDRAFLFILAD